MKVNSKVFIKKTTYVISTLLILTSLVAFFYSESFLKKKIQQVRNLSKFYLINLIIKIHILVSYFKTKHNPIGIMDESSGSIV